ncbi:MULTISPECIES: hypothetical protein [unclassified Rhizobium]|uniref:hypothetical protein n=1 Tax=unclassified Rhizobium TaxID=2613769 RepID=UPI0006FBEC7A|nr:MULTISPECIES: hypothetical protein [unclassified Rhizobium]KQV42725.1 hypothetical protein ASC86_18885 [Rhizobium sp. Root1212]KRD36459.1 hypothetical protein ASE37_19880 [Rhizobium sp. Root268]
MGIERGPGPHLPLPAVYRFPKDLSAKTRAQSTSLPNGARNRLGRFRRPWMKTPLAQLFKAPHPVRATVVVKKLLAEGLRIEILAQAVLDKTAS